MDLKIKINGEFTKEELQEKLKEFDKPVWEVKAGPDEGIFLHIDDRPIQLLLPKSYEDGYHNISTVSRDMAGAMVDLMETKDVLDSKKRGCYIYFDMMGNDWNYAHTYTNCSNKHFKTLETAKLASRLLNGSKDMRNWFKRMSE